MPAISSVPMLGDTKPSLRCGAFPGPVAASASFGKGGLVGRGGSRSPYIYSIRGQAHPSNPNSKAQPSPRERDGQTDRASCVQGECPHPTGSPWAPLWLQGARDPAARGVSHLFSLLKKQNHAHMFSDRENQAETGPLCSVSACKAGGGHQPETPLSRAHRYTCHLSGQTHLCFGGGQGTTGQLLSSRPENPIICSQEPPPSQCPPPHWCHTPAALATTT